jgi:hypothetical protein
MQYPVLRDEHLSTVAVPTLCPTIWILKLIDDEIKRTQNEEKKGTFKKEGASVPITMAEEESCLTRNANRRQPTLPKYFHSL